MITDFNLITAQFVDVFNNIVINRYNRDDTGKLVVKKELEVPCLVGNRSRVLRQMENKSALLVLPLVLCTLKSIARDPSRRNNVNQSLLYQNSNISKNGIRFTHGEPITVNFEVAILAKFQSDLEQIFQNYATLFNPDIFVVYSHYNRFLKKEKFNLKCQIIWNNDFSLELPSDLSQTDPVRYIGVSTFQFKTWIFPQDGLYQLNRENNRIRYVSIVTNPTTQELYPGKSDDIPSSWSKDSLNKMVLNRYSAIEGWVIPTNVSFNDFNTLIQENEKLIEQGLPGIFDKKIQPDEFCRYIFTEDQFIKWVDNRYELNDQEKEIQPIGPRK